MSVNHDYEVIIPREYGPNEVIDLRKDPVSLSTGDKFIPTSEYAQLKLLESIAWSLSGIDVTLRLEREDRLQRERETPWR